MTAPAYPAHRIRRHRQHGAANGCEPLVGRVRCGGAGRRPTALTNGWPIATGTIEGACRHIIADRWGAEAILKFCALCSNGDFDDYWTYPLAQERRRIHLSSFADALSHKPPDSHSKRGAPI